jgi:hypothetical protein
MPNRNEQKQAKKIDRRDDQNEKEKPEQSHKLGTYYIVTFN